MKTLSQRVANFNAGPAVLPVSVLEKAQAELLHFQKSGMSIMEMSHRSKEFMAILEGAEARLRRLLGISNDYEVLFLQGGASLQFSMVPLNLYQSGKPVDVIHTGYWTKKAIAELEKSASYRVVASSESNGFKKIPEVKKSDFHSDASYVYIASNNTIYGTQWSSFPETGDVPLVADMTSDILSRKIDCSRFGVIFAGAQKNVGPAGLTLVIIRKDLAERADAKLPSMLQYRTHIKGKSLYNTPPAFSIYICALVLEWMENQGGISAIEKQNREKAQSLYDFIDQSDFYEGIVDKSNRSIMNVVFRTKGSEEVEAKFVSEAKANGLVGLKGHRSVGGLRASLYSAQTQESVNQLIDFMKEFEKGK
ncbi:phosphoserine transaminase [bacterium F11]|nr:phosphoserine transaminase [bacterium F11]